MAISRILLNFGKAALNRAGFMTERQMVAATTRAGRYARDILSTGGTLSDELAGSIIRKSLPKGIKAPDVVTVSADKAADWVAKGGTYSREMVLNYASRTGGFGARNPKTSKSLIFYNPEKVNENIFAHELRHYLDTIIPLHYKIEAKLSKFLMKFKSCKRYSQNLSPIAQQKYEKLEYMIMQQTGLINRSILKRLPFAPSKEGLLKMLEVSEENFDSYLSAQINDLLCGLKTKNKITLLKYFIAIMKSERNAQRAGARLTRAIGHLKPTESCPSDISAVFQEEIIKALKNELKAQRKIRYKSLLGFKVPYDVHKSASLNSKTEVSLVSPTNLGQGLKKLSENKRLQAALTDTGEPKKVLAWDDTVKKVVE